MNELIGIVGIIVGIASFAWMCYSAFKSSDRTPDVFIESGPKKASNANRTKMVNEYVFPSTIYSNILKKHPDLSESNFNKAIYALRIYFLSVVKGRGLHLGMPSKIVDDIWHEFILNTKDYQKFCAEVIGRFIHHVPDDESTRDRKYNLDATWRISSIIEELFNSVGSVPLLFRIDRELNIKAGFNYTIDDIEGFNKRASTIKTRNVKLNNSEYGSPSTNYESASIFGFGTAAALCDSTSDSASCDSTSSSSDSSSSGCGGGGCGGS